MKHEEIDIFKSLILKCILTMPSCSLFSNSLCSFLQMLHNMVYHFLLHQMLLHLFKDKIIKDYTHI